MTEFSEHLKQIRKARGFTQKDVAAAIEITERNYQCYESGSKKPGFLFAPVLNLKRHIHFHGYSPSFLIASVKVLDVHTESICYPWQNRGARHRQTGFPLGNRRLIDANLFCKRVLCHFRFLP